MTGEWLVLWALSLDRQTALDLVLLLILVFSIVVHEVAHALVALWCGDPTAQRLGRLTLNPIVHIDPLMTLLLPALLLWASNGTFSFGAAKPVPFNPFNLRHPRRDPMFVAGAGPLSNLLLAVGFTLLSNLGPLLGGPAGATFRDLMLGGAILNLGLAVFNLIPIPPLDGSKIAIALLPDEPARALASLEPYGFFIVMGLLYVGALSQLITPFIVALWRLLSLLVFHVG